MFLNEFSKIVKKFIPNAEFTFDEQAALLDLVLKYR
jgi:hypothetical protein